MSFSIRCLFALAVLSSVPAVAIAAQEREGFARPDLEYRRLSKPSNTIGALGNDLFGEHVDHYSGQTSFSVTDISLPGNGDLSVALTRTKSIEEWDGYRPVQGMGGWEIEIPVLEGVFSEAKGWVGTGANPNARCSQGNGRPPDYTSPEGGVFLAEEYWQGYQLKVPGLPTQQMLLSNAQTQNRTVASRWTTKDRWLIDCLPTLKNGSAGEGFVATAPDGKKYFFDLMIIKDSQKLLTQIKRFMYSYTGGAGGICTSTVTYCTYSVAPEYSFMNQLDGAGGSGGNCPDRGQNGWPLVDEQSTGGSLDCLDSRTINVYATLYRTTVHLAATRVEDKFGNWVAYDYNTDGKLTTIRSNDGRQISLTYGSAYPYPMTASANGRVWNYSYDSSSKLLTKVTQPDASEWKYEQAGVMATGLLARMTDSEIPYEPCYDNALFGTNNSQQDSVLTYTITHPSGAQGEFQFMPRLQGKSNSIGCEYLAVSELSLKSKKINGAGLQNATWTFSYGPENSSLKTKIINPNGSSDGLPNDCTTMVCVTTVNTKITDPDGVEQRLTFGTRIDENDGQLLESQLSKNGKMLRKERYQYVLRGDTQAGFARKVGDNPKYQFDSIKSEYVLPQKKRLIEQDGTMFSWQANAFDPFGRATDITRSSSLGYSKTELLTYHDNKTNWTIGQMESISNVVAANVATSKIEAFRTFDPSTARITSQQEFGQLVGTYSWNSDGTLASVKDGNNNSTSFSNYYRGIPQRVTNADSSFETGVVDSNGWITSMTDVLGSSTGFAYDSLGRLTSITPPAGDAVAWSSTNMSFEKLTVSSYGLPVGSWKQTISKGNYRKENYLDAQWRVVLTREFDNANIAGTQRFTRQSYDSEGRVVFVSYPAVTDVATLGIRTSYDGLGRATKVEQDSELGTLITTTQYLPGTKVVVTDPKGNQTTTTYMLLDSPETTMPVIIKSPEGITTTIVRDVFGKPLSTSRHGAQN